MRTNQLSCNTAEDLLQALAPWHPHWGGDYRTYEWLFRGHANADWELVPKAFRSDAVLFTENGWGKLASGIRNREQILAEFETIRIFFKLADFSGLPVPEDNQRLRSILHGSTNLESIRELDHAGEGWPPRSLWSLLALGQHHGVPTRLLDWSRKPLTAAYFAAVDAARWLKDGAPSGQRNATEIAIWALSARDLNKAAEKLHDDRLTEPAAIQVTAPGAGDANLHAQGGQFTLVRHPADLDLAQPAERAPQTQVLKKSCALRKITLPIGETPRLLRLLALENANGASLFPAFEGVKKAMDERLYWDKQDVWF